MEDREELYYCVIGCVDGSTLVVNLHRDVLYGTNGQSCHDLESIKLSVQRAVEQATM